ncbi:MAG: hypothetical protein INH41_09550 [Myxococcaceae bacterium]|nr:hypothetical protein [Myxococcaceae bacterium]MCA3012628.1 hypothetical protein [Myxococcaceae bacterium]
MAEVLIRVGAVLERRRWRLAWLGLWAAMGGLLTFPIARIPGYELATGLALVLALVGGAFGIALGRALSREPITAPARQVTAAWLAACLLLLAPATVTLALGVALTLFTLPCSPFEFLAFVPVIVLPSAALVAALGVLLGVTVRRAGALPVAWLGVVLASALHTLWPIATGPQVFAYNHLAGFLPGPLYDENLSLGPGLPWFRLGTLLLTALALSVAALRLGGLTRRGLGLSLALLAGVLGLEGAGPALGFRMTDETLEQRLGGHVETEHLVLVYPRSLAPKQVARALGDLEFRYSQLAAFVGGAPTGKVRVWWYRDEAQKQALVGAASTQFAKPWRREVHVDDRGFPHPVIKHELAHALLAPLGAPPFGVTARGLGLVPNVGIIEGLAVAADDRADELTLQERAATMKRQHLLPDLRSALSVVGFYAESSARAYTAAGAFLRWLGDTRGAATLKDLYRDGDFERVYGEPLSSLVAAWEQTLDAVPLTPEAVNQGIARFSGQSLFERPCAREVERLSQAANEASTDAAGAADLLGRCQSLQPRETAFVVRRAQALRRLGRDDEARAALEDGLREAEAAPPAWGDAALELVELALARHDTAAARGLLERVIERRLPPATDRRARLRLYGLDAPAPVRDAIDATFTEPSPATVVYRLTTALAKAPHDPALAYLLGRQLFVREASADALPHLERALEDAPWPSVKAEALRLALPAAYLSDRCDRVRHLTALSPSHAMAARASADEWVARCAHREASATARP